MFLGSKHELLHCLDLQASRQIIFVTDFKFVLNIPFRSMSWTLGIGNPIPTPVSGSALSSENVALNLHFNALDHQLQVGK